jgi:hypothetical protein
MQVLACSEIRTLILAAAAALRLNASFAGISLRRNKPLRGVLSAPGQGL